MQELIDDSTTFNNSSSFNFRLLLLSVFTDRFAFYGLRSIVVLYAVSNLNVPNDQVIFYYGFYLLISSISSLIGGILSDFLTGPKLGMIIGFSLCLLGSLFSLVENASIFLLAMTLILIGTVFFRSSSFSFIGYISLYKNNLLEKRFIAQYAIINAGAFLSSITIRLVAELSSYFYALILVCTLYVISLIIVSFLPKGEIDSRNTVDSKTKEELSTPSWSNIKLLIISFIGISIFWIVTDQLGYARTQPNIIYDAKIFGFQLPFSLIFVIPGLFTIILTIPHYYLANRISPSLKLALGCFLISIAWISWEVYFPSNEIVIGLAPILLFGLFEGITDLFVGPSMMTLICQNSPKKYYGTLFGIYSIIFFAGVKLSTFIANEGVSTKIILAICLIGTAIFFLILPQKFKTRKIITKEELNY